MEMLRIRIVGDSFQKISMFIWIIKNSYMRIDITLIYFECTLKLIFFGLKDFFVFLFYLHTVPIFQLRQWRHSISRRRNSFDFCNR